jgi:hypothetical protein
MISELAVDIVVYWFGVVGMGCPRSVYSDFGQWTVHKVLRGRLKACSVLEHCRHYSHWLFSIVFVHSALQ